MRWLQVDQEAKEIRWQSGRRVASFVGRYHWQLSGACGFVRCTDPWRRSVQRWQAPLAASLAQMVCRLNNWSKKYADVEPQANAILDELPR